MDSDETVMWETTLKPFKGHWKNLLLEYKIKNDVVKKRYWNAVQKHQKLQKHLTESHWKCSCLATLERPQLEGGDPMASCSRVGLIYRDTTKQQRERGIENQKSLIDRNNANASSWPLIGLNLNTNNTWHAINKLSREK